jgi:hypothetical protein
MTEIATSAIALMLTIEVGVAIAFAAAWFTWQQVGESAPSDRHDPAPVSRPSFAWIVRFCWFVGKS